MPAPLRALSTLARRAIAYAEHGWHVFPLLPRGKRPLIAGGGGFLAATSDVAAVERWWIDAPNANIGLWPGQSGLVVIDLDGPAGEASARALGLLSEPTLECRTGRTDGGRHLYFRRPDFTVSNTTIAPSIDVRGDAGYVILPPSVHPSGRRYEWLGKVEDIRELPPLTLERLRTAQEAQAATESGERLSADPSVLSARTIVFEDVLGEGGRNNALTRYPG